MFLFKNVSVKQKRPSFNVAVDAMLLAVNNRGFSVVAENIALGQLLSSDPLPGLLPSKQDINPNLEPATAACVEWLRGVAPRFPLRASRISELVALCYPKVSEEKLTAALIGITGLFLYDDYIDKLSSKSGDTGLTLRERQIPMRRAFVDPTTAPLGGCSSISGDSLDMNFVQMVASMGRLLQAVVCPEFLPSVHAAFSGYLDAMVDETRIRTQFTGAYSTGVMSAVLDTDERHFLRLRSRSSGVEFVFSLCAAFDGFSLGTSRTLHVIDNAVLSCGDAIGVFNDITTLRKDLLEGLTENLVLIIAEKSFFNRNNFLETVSPGETRNYLFYRDICTISLLGESEKKRDLALASLQVKYELSLSLEEKILFLSSEPQSFLGVVEAKFVGECDFRSNILDPWIRTLQESIFEATTKYYNKEVSSFYTSVASCKEAAEIEPDQFSSSLLTYFDNLESWLSGSGWWSIDPENKRYNWWRS